jgi:hypothetical protein
MATTKTTTPRSGAKTATRARSTASKTTATKTSTTKAATRSTASPRPKDDSLVARTGRTIKERPYTSAAIATGAVGVVAAAAAAGAFLVSRRDKSFKEATGELSTKVKDGLASASDTVRDGLSSASDTVRELGQRGADYLKGDGSDGATDTRTQREIAEEALTLKETGAAANSDLSATELKAGAISY